MKVRPMEDTTNIFLHMDIRDKDFSDLCELLRSGEINKIHQDTWNLLADHLEGKIKGHPGRKWDVWAHLFKNEPCYEEFKKLCDEGLTQEDARSKMGERIAAKKGGHGTDYEEIIRGRIEVYIKNEKRLNDGKIQLSCEDVPET